MAQHNGHDPHAALLDALRENGQRVHGGHGTWTATCPAHPDRNPSLSIGTGADGRALVHCHAGCHPQDILAALGLTPSQLFADHDDTRSRGAVIRHLRAFDPTPKPPPAPTGPPPIRTKTDHWDYHDPTGSLVARVVRYSLTDPDTGEIVGKTFTQHAIIDGQQQPTLGGMQMPLYRLPDVLAAIAAHGPPVAICEGERDADTAAALGLAGTTCPQGAGSWKPHHTESLAGARGVLVIADDDPPGHAHAHLITETLRAAGVEVAPMLPAEGCKDLTEHIAAGHTIADLRRMEPPDPREEVRARFPAVDWHALWADDTADEWIVEPLLPARRLVALYSAPKVGKSLLMLEIAVGIARGTRVLGYATDRPRRVLYIDFENDPRADTRERLRAMGVGPDDLGNLVMLSFPTLAALDSPRGADELMAAIDAHGCEVVVIDTVSRAIAGEENENDTWLNFYRNTGLALKQAGVAMIRLDHTGKDETKGQRGGSAKSGDVDAIWRMSKINDTTLQLDCDAARLPITEKRLILHRRTEPHLHHYVDPASEVAGFGLRVDDLIARLDADGVPDDASNKAVGEWKERSGWKGRNDVVAEAVRVRKARLPQWERGGE